MATRRRPPILKPSESPTRPPNILEFFRDWLHFQPSPYQTVLLKTLFGIPLVGGRAFTSADKGRTDEAARVVVPLPILQQAEPSLTDTQSDLEAGLIDRVLGFHPMRFRQVSTGPRNRVPGPAMRGKGR